IKIENYEQIGNALEALAQHVEVVEVASSQVELFQEAGRKFSIKVIAEDRTGVTYEITKAIRDLGVKIFEFSSISREGNEANYEFILQVPTMINSAHIKQALEDIEGVAAEVEWLNDTANKGSPLACLNTLYSHNNFSNNPVSVKELIRERAYSATTIRVELDNLVALGLVEVDKQTRPYRYYLTDTLKRAPPEAISEITALPELNLYQIPSEQITQVKKQIRKILDAEEETNSQAPFFRKNNEIRRGNIGPEFLTPNRTGIAPSPVLDYNAIALEGSIYSIIHRIEEVFFKKLRENFAKEYRIRGEYVVCREASYILTRVINQSLDLPIGGYSPERIELTSGAVLNKESSVRSLHRWIAVYINNRKVLLIDPTYAQFDKQFRDKIFIGEYSKAMNEFYFIEWEDLKEREKGRLDCKLYSDEEIKDILYDRWKRSVQSYGYPGISLPLLSTLIEFSALVVDVKRGTDIDPDIKKNNSQIENIIAEIYQRAEKSPVRTAVEIPSEDFDIEVMLAGGWLEDELATFKKGSVSFYMVEPVKRMAEDRANNLLVGEERKYPARIDRNMLKTMVPDSSQQPDIRAEATILRTQASIRYIGNDKLSVQEEDFFLQSLRKAYLGLANAPPILDIPLLFSYNLQEAARVNNTVLELNRLLFNTAGLAREEIESLSLVISREILPHEIKHILSPKISEKNIRRESLEYIAQNPEVNKALLYIHNNKINAVVLDSAWRQLLEQRLTDSLRQAISLALNGESQAKEDLSKGKFVDFGAEYPKDFQSWLQWLARMGQASGPLRSVLESSDTRRKELKIIIDEILFILNNNQNLFDKLEKELEQITEIKSSGRKLDDKLKKQLSILDDIVGQLFLITDIERLKAILGFIRDSVTNNVQQAHNSRKQEPKPTVLEERLETALSRNYKIIALDFDGTIYSIELSDDMLEVLVGILKSGRRLAVVTSGRQSHIEKNFITELIKHPRI
ncbi:MAG: hypothetical protein KJ838_05575, partial [Candidatus Omnitrophica bacterium]|nr:hypothetical protein [Candidatus Omnitrophota bacterium]